MRRRRLSFARRWRGLDPDAIRDFLGEIAEQLEEEARTRGELRAQIARSVTAGSNTKVVAQGEPAEAILDITGDLLTKNVLALSTAGQIRQYQIVRSFSFRLHNDKGVDLLPPSTITLRRDVSFNDNQLLAKQQEEVLLLRDMQNDLVQQLLRRLSAAKAEGVKDY